MQDNCTCLGLASFPQKYVRILVITARSEQIMTFSTKTTPMAHSFACLMAFIGLDHGIFWCLMNISNLTFTKMFIIPMFSVIPPQEKDKNNK